ncbi:hypothetical protein ABZP36_009134 [Zizania latifolia]
MGGSKNRGSGRREEQDRHAVVVREDQAEREMEEDKNFSTSFFKVLLPELSVQRLKKTSWYNAENSIIIQPDSSVSAYWNGFHERSKQQYMECRACIGL